MSLFMPRQLEMVIIGDVETQICPGCGRSIAGSTLSGYLRSGGGYQGTFRCGDRSVGITHMPYLINELEVELTQI